MVRNAAVAALVGLLGVAASAEGYDGFRVTAPAKGVTVLANSLYTVEWTGYFADTMAEIDLFYCGFDCPEDACGDFVASLCPYESGCPDNKGDYDVIMPKPLIGAESGGMYKVRVRDHNDKSNWSCSGGFELVLAEDVVIDVDAGWLPGVTVISPREGDLAFAGETYTVLFDYFDQVGSRVGRFNIDLYESNGGDGCDGGYVTSICDKPSIGCKDSRGDYDVRIPRSIPEGYYKIRISPFDDVSTYDCSGEFIVSSGRDDVDDASLDEDDITFAEDDDDYLSFSFSYSYDT